jgi:(p)ppGpp synthase/HD superfamily hydrolase
MERHKGQMYGEESYVVGHLAEVAEVLETFGFTDSIWKARGWLHDVVEDTNTSINEIREKFGDDVAWPVWACSGFGRNRKERNADIYRKLDIFGREAAILKVADRIANCESGAKNEMYRKELPEFAKHTKHHVPAVMWERLELALGVTVLERMMEQIN